MYSQREIVSMRCQVESLSAQLEYLLVQIETIDNFIRLENEKNDLVIEEQTQKLSQPLTDEAKQEVIAYYEQFHTQFFEIVTAKQQERVQLVSQHTLLWKTKRRLVDILDASTS
jgi:hypothetical protein